MSQYRFFTLFSRMMLFLFSSLVLSCGWFSLPNGEPVEYHGPLEPVEGSGQVYYLAADGDDSASGTSEAEAWQSIGQLNRAGIDPGSVVYFKRGDSFRGPLYPVSGTEQGFTTYGAYGTGELPVLHASLVLDDAADWMPLSGNLWQSTAGASINIDLAGYDIAQVFWGTDALPGHRVWSSASLSEQGEFFSDKSSGTVTVYSTENPVIHYGNSRITITEHIIDQSNTSFLYFKDLHLRYGGAHGFGGGNTHRMVIEDCEFSFIGGGWLEGAGDRVRYGNGVEFWGNASDHLVRRNYFHDIYDTAMTNQNHTSVTYQNNIYYINNLVSRCGLASFEVWNRPGNSKTAFIYFLHNTCWNPGYGWGQDREEDRNAFQVASYGHQAATDTIVIRNNLFATEGRPAGYAYQLQFFAENTDDWFSELTAGGNLWYGGATPAFVFSNVQYDDLAAVQIALNTFDSDVEGNPLFVDPDSGDFSLSSGSPAINAGVALSLVPTDFYGAGRTGAPDAGALEY